MGTSLNAPERTSLTVPDPAEAAARARALLLQRADVVAGGAADVPSPCVSVCRMNPDRSFCEGCFRSIDEIRVWSRSDDAQKRVVWDRLLQRMDAAVTHA